MDQYKKIIVKNQTNMESRQCCNCKKTYQFVEIKKKYPKLCHSELNKIWNNPDIEFYCSFCYFLKLIGYLNKKKSKHIDRINPN